MTVPQLSPVPASAIPAALTAAREGRIALHLGDGRWLVHGKPWARWLERGRGVSREQIIRLDRLPPNQDPLTFLQP